MGAKKLPLLSAIELIEVIARVCHEANRAFCHSLGDFSQETWDVAPEWQRDSARKGVEFHLNGNHSAFASHDSWMREKLEMGWTYGPVKNPQKKQHPCIVPFDLLPKEQQMKDYLFRGIVHAFKKDSQ